MKPIYLIPVWALILWMMGTGPAPGTDPQSLVREKKRTAVSCVPERSRAMVMSGINLLPGSGKHHWKISNHDSAQIYFDQGINMYYSFHIIEALASFVKAQQFEPDNAMLHWGEALTYSPNINDVGYIQPEDALKAVRKAIELAPGRSAMERELITAMNSRFSESSAVSRAQLNETYQNAMAKMAARYPAVPDILALYADALMILHPWDLYNGDGSPKPWTPKLVSVLEKGIKLDTDHPGLNHYYIHAVEGSSDPGRGLASADKLDRIVPGAAHMVHMPSHIYIRTGNYNRGIEVNIQALKGYESYKAIYPEVSRADFLYLIHNSHLMAACAIMNGHAETAIRISKECAGQVPEAYHSMEGPMADFTQYISATPVFAYVRYGRWDALLAPASLADSSLYLRILHGFGRGVAKARLGRISEAKEELVRIKDIMENHPKLKLRAFNTAYDGADVARHMLEGIIAEQEKDYEQAELMLEKAADLEAAMVYNEPKDWILPPLPYLGAVQLKANKFLEAEKTFRKDLAFNPYNVWSLKGLMMAQLYQGRKNEADKTSKALQKAMEGSDMGKMNGPVF